MQVLRCNSVDNVHCPLGNFFECHCTAQKPELREELIKCCSSLPSLGGWRGPIVVTFCRVCLCSCTFSFLIQPDADATRMNIFKLTFGMSRWPWRTYISSWSKRHYGFPSMSRIVLDFLNLRHLPGIRTPILLRHLQMEKSVLSGPDLETCRFHVSPGCVTLWNTHLTAAYPGRFSLF